MAGRSSQDNSGHVPYAAMTTATPPNGHAHTGQRVRFTENIPIEPQLLKASGHELEERLTDPAQSDADSSGGNSDTESGTSSGSESNDLDENDIQESVSTTTLSGFAEDALAAGRGRSRGRPKGRGLGGRLSGRPGRNPLHVREQAAPKGSKPRGSKKGVKKGPRKALEPSEEFKALKSRATVEYINGNFEEAQAIVEEAIAINPEIFSAYALLSSIHQATGDDRRAVAALFQGAHTTPRDTETWKSVAQSILELAQDREAALKDAVYCYNRVISTDREDIEARTNRAHLLVELGRYPKAIHDFKQVLSISPHHLETIRALSECYGLMGDPSEAIAYYDGAVGHYRAQNNAQGPSELWSDVNIYAELYWMSAQYEQGLFKVKQIARWLLGRGLQSYWDERNEDDREFDADDSRRANVMEHDPSQHDITAYGLGLPIELRVRLGLFRLKLGSQDYEEAVGHLAWLNPAGLGNEDAVDDYADLIHDVANTLKVGGHFEQAAEYFEQLKTAPEVTDVRFYIDLGECYRHLQLYPEAAAAFQEAANVDEYDLEGYTELLKLYQETGDQALAMQARGKLSLRRGKKALHEKQKLLQTKAGGDPDVPVTSIEDPGVDVEETFDARMLAQPQTQKKAPELARFGESSAPGRTRFKQYELALQDMIPTFRRLEYLEAGFRTGDVALQQEWMVLAKEAIEHLQAYKPFWPTDRLRAFAGYSKSTRDRVTTARGPLLSEKTQSPSTSNATSDEIPDHYCGVPFSDWLACIMRYVLRLPTGTNETTSREAAYSICKTFTACSVWLFDKEAQFMIHLVWSLCAVQRNDHETYCDLSRFFMKQYQFVSDSYRMYAALNRFCNYGNDRYNSSPAQKHMLRQIKAMDLCLLEKSGTVASCYNERAQLATKDERGTVVTAKENDVALLVMYGHILFAATSYAYALHYFYRAHDVEPNNPMVLWSLAIGYTHYAMKRQAENRQALISCGLSFLFRYYDTRKVASSPLHRQEAEYNVGKAFHYLGLVGLAIPYYERCLVLSSEVQKLPAEQKAQDFAREAAYALRGFYAQAGDFAGARRIVETWLQL